MDQPIGQAKAKGTLFVSAMGVVTELKGPEANAKVLLRLPEKDRTFYTNEVVTSGWYPASTYGQWLRALCETFSSEPNFARTIGITASRKDFSTLYAMLFKMPGVTPATIMSWGPRAFGRYYQGGQMSVAHSGPRSVEVVYKGWVGFNQEMWQAVTGGTESALLASRAKTVSASIVAAGTDDACTVHVTWTV